MAASLSRETLERLADRLPAGELAAAEAESLRGRARLRKRHHDVLAAHAREAALAARAAIGTPDFPQKFERANALRRATDAAHRSWARARLRAERAAR